MNAGTKIHPARAPWIIVSNFIRKIYVQSDLIRNFVIRDLKGRYVGSFMGFFWSVIHPIVLLTSYAFVFMVVFGQQAPQDSGTDSFPLFLFCGILPWLFFQDTVQRSSTVIVDNSNLITKTLFPTEILPLTVMLAGLVNHLIGFAILFGILCFVGEIKAMILLLPVYMLLMMLFSLGMAWFISSLQVFLRDVSQVLTVVLTFWFWFTPIFYTESKIPPKFAHFAQWLKFNPLGQVVTGYRHCLLDGRWPDLRALAILALISLAVFVAGGMFFRNIKREFVDVL
jgi:ABC-type polysaccharide/polyol phosphate export permease